MAKLTADHADIDHSSVSIAIGGKREQATTVCKQARMMASTLSFKVGTTARPLSPNLSRNPRRLRAEAARIAGAYIYGQSFKGKDLPDDSGIDVVTAKPLRVGVVYEISTVSGATGYGSGAFKILPDHRVVNVASPSMLVMEDSLNEVRGNGS